MKLACNIAFTSPWNTCVERARTHTHLKQNETIIRSSSRRYAYGRQRTTKRLPLW